MPGKTEITQGIANIYAFIALDGVDPVRMVADHKISAAVNGESAHFDLVISGPVPLFVAPVEGNDHDRIVFLGICDIGGDFVVKRRKTADGLVITIDAEVAEHRDLDVMYGE